MHAHDNDAWQSERAAHHTHQTKHCSIYNTTSKNTPKTKTAILNVLCHTDLSYDLCGVKKEICRRSSSFSTRRVQAQEEAKSVPFFFSIWHTQNKKFPTTTYMHCFLCLCFVRVPVCCSPSPLPVTDRVLVTPHKGTYTEEITTTPSSFFSSSCTRPPRVPRHIQKHLCFMCINSHRSTNRTL